LPARWRQPRPAPVPPPAPQTSEGFQGPLPLAGVQRAAPSGGVRGKALVLLWFTRLPSGPGACAVAGSATGAARRDWAARAGWRARPGRELVHGVLARRRRWGWVRGLVHGVLARARRAGFDPPVGAAWGGGLAWRSRARPPLLLRAGSRRGRWRRGRRRRELVHGVLPRRRRAGGVRRLVRGVLPGARRRGRRPRGRRRRELVHGVLARRRRAGGVRRLVHGVLPGGRRRGR
jgi:hypothetical protein